MQRSGWGVTVELLLGDLFVRDGREGGAKGLLGSAGGWIAEVESVHAGPMIEDLRPNAAFHEVALGKLEFTAGRGHVVEVLGPDVDVFGHQLPVAALFSQPVDVFLIAAAEYLASSIPYQFQCGVL